MIYLVIGRRSMGKTTLAYWMASRHAIRIVWDARGQIGPPAQRARTADELRGGLDAIAAGTETLVVYTPDEDIPTAFPAFAGAVATLIRDRPRLALAIVIDEAALLGPAAGDPDFLWLLRCADRDRVHVMLTAHRPKDVPVDIRAIADSWLLFRMRQEHDLAVVAERSPEAAALVPDLLPRQFVRWDDRDATLTVHRAPELWRVALDAPLIGPLRSSESA